MENVYPTVYSQNCASSSYRCTVYYTSFCSTMYEKCEKEVSARLYGTLPCSHVIIVICLSLCETCTKMA
jgi:hypothetical protein